MAEKLSITIACFFWFGDRWVRNDSWAGVPYINRLYSGVANNIPSTCSWRFICFTNEHIQGLKLNIEVRPFRVLSTRGVLPRLFAYSSEAGLQGQVLLLDLDVVIVGRLDDIVSYRGLFCARSKFASGQQHKLDGDVISFSAGDEIERMIWSRYAADVRAAEDATGGRERYWYRMTVGDIADRWDVVCPHQVVSYKHHVRKHGGLPPGARIVSCHGQPRPHQIDEPWVHEHWWRLR